MTRWSATGTKKGELMGFPANGKQVIVTGMSEILISGRKILAQWN
jgi:predicted ester cyclase